MKFQKGKKRSLPLPTLFLLILLTVPISYKSKTQKKHSKTTSDSEDLAHLRHQLRKLIQQQKIYNLIKKKGKLKKLAQEGDQVSEEVVTGDSGNESTGEGIENTMSDSETNVDNVESGNIESGEEVGGNGGEIQEGGGGDEEGVQEDMGIHDENGGLTENDVQEEGDSANEEVDGTNDDGVVNENQETPEDTGIEESPDKAEDANILSNTEDTDMSSDIQDNTPEENPDSNTENPDSNTDSPETTPEDPENTSENPDNTPGNPTTSDAQANNPEPENHDECSDDDTTEECLEKRLKSKLVHLLGVFDSLYSSMEEVCQASESVCKKILDRIKEFENLRPESSEKEMEVALHDTVKETSDNVFEIAKQQLDLKGEDNIKKLNDMIQEEQKRLEEGFKSQLGKYETEEQLRNQVSSQTTKVLKNTVESFYLNDYLGSNEGLESESSESEDDPEETDPEDSLIQEITNGSGVESNVNSEKMTGLAKKRSRQKKKAKKKRLRSKRKGKKDLDLDLDSLSDKTTLELLSSLLK